MGVVYRAHQLDLDRDVAVKVIAPETLATFVVEHGKPGAVNAGTSAPAPPSSGA